MFDNQIHSCNLITFYWEAEWKYWNAVGNASFPKITSINVTKTVTLYSCRIHFIHVEYIYHITEFDNEDILAMENNIEIQHATEGIPT